ncbi:MAG: hypothetical protein AAGH78_16275 [Cyanobacteria bacterium P01_H01_bin.58]
MSRNPQPELLKRHQPIPETQFLIESLWMIRRTFQETGFLDKLILESL